MKKISNLKFQISNFRIQLLLLVLIFAVHLFLRFYDMENRSPFGWDQVDNAWAAKNILIDEKFPLTGPQVKQNTGFFLGPIYYYYISPFYWAFDMDPVASFIVAGITSIISFSTVFYIFLRLFSFPVALIAVFINTVSLAGIDFDRVQWNVNFLPIVSLMLLYTLYRIMTGNTKYLILLGLMLGLSFHVHLTSIIYPIIILLVLPFFPKTKDTIKYGVLGSLIFFIFIIPMILNVIQHTDQASNFLQYSQTYYHGFHLRRFFQLANDAFIQFEPFLVFPYLKFLKFLLPFLFTFFYIRKKPTRGKIILCYLVFLWFLVPWFVLSLYRGEISEYYFSANRFVALFILAYLLFQIVNTKSKVFVTSALVLLFLYALFNIQVFLNRQHLEYSLKARRESVLRDIQLGKKRPYELGIPESYIYYYYYTYKQIKR